MEMNIFTLVLIACIVGLVAYIAYMKGRTATGGKSNKAKAPGPVRDNSDEVLVNLNVEEIATPKKSVVRRDPENSKYLSTLKNRLMVAQDNEAANIPYKIFAAFLEMHGNLCDYTNTISNTQSNNVVEINKVVNWGPLSKARSEIEKSIVAASNYLAEFSSEYIEYLHTSFPNANMRSLLRNEMQTETGRQRIQAMLRKTLQVFYSEFNELVSIQLRCISLWRIAKPIFEESDIDVPGLAKNFGLGALAAVNPFIGIPAIIASFFGDNEKQKRKQQAVEEFGACFHDYLSQWDEVKNLIVNNIEETMTRDIKKFLADDFYTPIIKAFESADNAGYSIKEKTNELIEYLEKE